jgi:cytochrome c553
MIRVANILCCATLLTAFALPAPVLASGATNYASRCSMCHQPSGAGLAGQFPRLSGRAAQIASTADGRAYLAKVLLFGLYGPINVDGKPITGMMPAVGSMADQDIADLLNHLVSLQKAAKPVAAFSAAEVGKVRAQGKLTSSGVAAVRTDLATKGIVP